MFDTNHEDNSYPCGNICLSVLRHLSADDSNNHHISLDNTDLKIVSLMVTGNENKQMSSKLKIPLSTIQLRVRNILLSGTVQVKVFPNFKRLGIKKGLLHVYL